MACNYVFAGSAAADYGERGLAAGTIDAAPGLFRKAVITDPEGTIITFAEDVSRDD